MTPELIAGLVAAAVALATSAIASLVTWISIQRERTKWLTELKMSLVVERYKTRLHTFPRASEILGRLSGHATEPLTPEIAASVGHELNDWFYSAGGLCADQSTRGALLNLRDKLLDWTEGSLPPTIRQWRDAALFCLRRDLDLKGLDTYSPETTETLLAQLKREMQADAA